MKLIIFDIDGTLVDSRDIILQCFSKAFDELGLPQLDEERVLSIVGLSLPQACQELVGDDAAQALVRYYQENFIRISTQMEKTGPKLFAGIAELIEKLSALPDIMLGLATGNSFRGVNRLLDAYNWHEHFVTIQTADNAPSKPHPAMLLQAMEECGTEKPDTIMIGDTSFDIDMAVAAGIPSIGVVWGNHTKERLIQAHASHIAHDSAELSALLSSFSAQAI